MIPDDIIDEAQKLIRHVASEARDRNIYLLDQTDIPLAPASRCYAYCSKLTIPSIRDYLDSIGQWRGQGPVVIYDTEKIVDDFGDFRRAFLETTLHELAHLLPLSVFAPIEYEPTHEERERCTEQHNKWVDIPSPQVGTDDHGDHGDRFIRMACHVWYRAVAIGFVPQAHNMFAGYNYSLSHPHEYYEALAGEPFRLAGETFNTIAKTEPPTAFQQLWKSDLARLQDTK